MALQIGDTAPDFEAETTEGKHGIMMNAKNCISRLPAHMSKRIILDRLEKPGVQKMSCATDIFNMQYRFQISAHVVFIIIFLFIVVIVVVGIDRLDDFYCRFLPAYNHRLPIISSYDVPYHSTRYLRHSSTIFTSTMHHASTMTMFRS